MDSPYTLTFTRNGLFGQTALRFCSCKRYSDSAYFVLSDLMLAEDETFPVHLLCRNFYPDEVVQFLSHEQLVRIVENGCESQAVALMFLMDLKLSDKMADTFIKNIERWGLKQHFPPSDTEQAANKKER